MKNLHMELSDCTEQTEVGLRTKLLNAQIRIAQLLLENRQMKGSLKGGHPHLGKYVFSDIVSLVWGNAPEWAAFLTMDTDGQYRFWENHPQWNQSSGAWWGTSGKCQEAKVISGMAACNSLRARP